jgi:hypothetical protein
MGHVRREQGVRNVMMNHVVRFTLSIHVKDIRTTEKQESLWKRPVFPLVYRVTAGTQLVEGRSR